MNQPESLWRLLFKIAGVLALVAAVLLGIGMYFTITYRPLAYAMWMTDVFSASNALLFFILGVAALVYERRHGKISLATHYKQIRRVALIIGLSAFPLFISLMMASGLFLVNVYQPVFGPVNAADLPLPWKVWGSVMALFGFTSTQAFIVLPSIALYLYLKKR